MGILGDLSMLYYFRNCEIKNTGLVYFLSLTRNTYWDNTCAYIDATWAWPTRLWRILAWRAQITMYFSSSWIHMVWLPPIACIYLCRGFATWCLRIKHESHNALYVPLCGISFDYLVSLSMWLFYLRKNTRWYERWTLLHFFVELMLPLGSLAWDLVLILDGFWGFHLISQLAWFWYN